MNEEIGHRRVSLLGFFARCLDSGQLRRRRKKKKKKKISVLYDTIR